MDFRLRVFVAGGSRKIMRDARHDHSSFLMAANMQYLQFSGSMDTSKCTPDQPQHLCSSTSPSLHFCNTCLETRCLPAVAGVVRKLLWHWMNTCLMFCVSELPHRPSLSSIIHRGLCRVVAKCDNRISARLWQQTHTRLAPQT